MRSSIKAFVFITFFVSGLGCKLNANNMEKTEFPETVVITGEKTGPYGDSSFLSILNQIILSHTISSGHEYYISANASTEGNGSSSSPFKTFSNALSKLSAGDTLYVMSGTYYEQIILDSSLRGNQNAYITIAAVQNNANDSVISGHNAEDDFMLMKIEGAAYVRISGLCFKNSHGMYAGGIQIGPGSNHIIVDNCNFSDIKVPEPKIKDHVANGILCYGEEEDASINNILIYNNNFFDMATGWGECISVVANCEFVNIIHNTVDGTGNIGIDVGGNYGYCKNPALDFVRYVYIAENTVKNCESAYGDTSYGIYSDGGQHIHIYNNTVENCSGGIEVGAEEPQKSKLYATHDILIENNTVSYSEECALAIGGYKKDLGLVSSVKAEKNTFINNANKEDGSLISISKCDGVLITENSFIHNDGVFKGSVLYKALPKAYSKNVSIKNNFYTGLDSADE